MANEQKINTYTGEVYDSEEQSRTDLIPLTDPTMMSLMSGQIPWHLQMLKMKNLSAEEEEYQVDLFTGIEPVSLKPYINKTITVLGAVCWPHGEFVRGSDQKDGPGKKGDLAPGYWQILMLLSDLDSNGNNIVVACGGVNIIPHMVLAMDKKGWYLWEKPTKYLVTVGSKNGAFFMKNVDRPAIKIKEVNHKA